MSSVEPIETERLLLRAITDRESGAFLGRSGLKHWGQFEETELGWAL